MLNSLTKFFENKEDRIKNDNFYKNYYANLPDKSFHYFLIFLYIINLTICSFLSLPNNLNIRIFSSILIFFYFFNLFFSFLILFVFLKEEINSHYIKLFWSIFLIYILFSSGILMFISNFYHIHIMIFALSSLIFLTFFEYRLFSLILFSLLIIYFFIYKRIDEEIEFLSYDKSNLYIYITFILSASLAIFIRNRTMAKNFSKKNQYDLELSNEYFSKELLKALNHQKRFIDTIDSECIDAFVTLHQISKDLNDKLIKAKNSKDIKKIGEQIMTVLNQNQYVSNYLLQIIYKYKDHIRLKVKTTKLSDFIFNIKNTYNKTFPILKNKSKIYILNESTYKDIECDPLKICSLINESIKFIDNNNFSHGNLITIKLSNAFLDYKISFMKNYKRRIEALKIVISNDLLFLDSNNIFKGDYKNFSIILPRNIKEFSNMITENILNAHYGFMDTIYKKKSITQIYVIPKILRRVRPKVMDIE